MEHLVFLMSVGLLVDGRLQGNNICFERNVTRCCTGYFEKENICLACPTGTYGNPCTLCPNGYYGNQCVKKCKCLEKEVCHPAFGCQKSKDEVLKEDKKNVFNLISRHASTPEMLIIGILMLITITCLIRLIAAMCDKHRRKGTRPTFFIEDNDINRQSTNVDRTTVYVDDPWTNYNEDIYRHDATPTTEPTTSKSHYGNCGIEHFTYRQEVASTALPPNTRSHYGNCGIENFSCTRL